jgi:hypothetical protein
MFEELLPSRRLECVWRYHLGPYSSNWTTAIRITGLRKAGSDQIHDMRRCAWTPFRRGRCESECRTPVVEQIGLKHATVQSGSENKRTRPRMRESLPVHAQLRNQMREIIRDGNQPGCGASRSASGKAPSAARRYGLGVDICHRPSSPRPGVGSVSNIR